MTVVGSLAKHQYVALVRHSRVRGNDEFQRGSAKAT